MKKKNKKKVLIITYYWPPSGGAGVQRWLKFVKYLPEFGWEPVVYTPENPEVPAVDETLMDEVPDSARIIKKKIKEPYGFYKKLTGKTKSDNINAGFLDEKGSGSIFEKLSVFIRGNLFIPDARCLWINPSVKFLSHYLHSNPVDVIVSTGPPHSMHLIAMKLKEILNIPWVADFRDPWTDIDYYHQLLLTTFADKKHRRLEKNVLHNADRVIAIGKGATKFFEEKVSRNYDVITNGYDENDLPDKKIERSRKFSIVHVGAMNKDRNYEVFWEVLSELVDGYDKFREKLEIRLIGKTDATVKYSIENKGLQGFVKYINYLDHKSAVEEELKASVLYLPINNTPNAKSILTGKIFEYLAAQRPIIAMSFTGGDVEELIEETRSGILLPANKKEFIKESILKYFNLHQKGDLKLESSSIEKYSRKNLTKELSVILQSFFRH